MIFQTIPGINNYVLNIFKNNKLKDEYNLVSYKNVNCDGSRLNKKLEL